MYYLGDSSKTSPSGSQSHRNLDDVLKPASFWDDKVCQEYKTTQVDLEQDLSESQKSLMTEIHDYLTTANCTWAPGRPHLNLIEVVLTDTQNFKEALVEIVARLMQNLLTKTDLLSQCTMDPHSRNVICNIVLKLEQYSTPVQEILLKTLCNLTQTSGFYESLSSDIHSASLSILTRSGLCTLCKECLLTAVSIRVTGTASALAYNLLQNQLSDDLVTDLGMALVHVCTKPVPDIYVKYCLHSLLKCIQRNSEVAALAAVMDLKIDDLSKEDSSLENVKKKIVAATQNVC